MSFCNRDRVTTAVRDGIRTGKQPSVEDLLSQVIEVDLTVQKVRWNGWVLGNNRGYVAKDGAFIAKFIRETTGPGRKEVRHVIML